MKTVEIEFDNVLLLVPEINGGPLGMPYESYETFDTFCGPGKGLGDLLVPDDIDDIIVSPPCYIHDTMFAIAAPTWGDFHYSNSVFLHNIIQTLTYFSINDSGSARKYHRFYRAITYYMFVDCSKGAKIFWDLKKKQGKI